MPFKINISNKGKSYKIESEDETLVGKSIGDVIDGKEIAPELEGYELEVKGGSDKAGFPMTSEVEGLGLKKVILKKGFGMKKKQKGLRLRKTVRGKIISDAISQINLVVLKEGKKKFDELGAKEEGGEGAEGSSEKPAEAPRPEEKKEEAPKEESKAEENPAEEKKG